MGISNVSSNSRPGICTSTTRPGSPYDGQTIYETDTDTFLTYNGSLWIPYIDSTKQFPFKNLLMNGDFRIGQRGTSFTSTTSPANNDDTFLLDRWTLLSDGNDIVDVTRSTDAPTGGLNSIGLDVETINKKFGIVQFIEQKNILGLQGQYVTLSFKARVTGSSISNVKAAVLSWTGTADAVTSDIVSAWNADSTLPSFAANWTLENVDTPANLGVTTSWASYSLTALLDTSSIKNVAVFIWCDDLTTTLTDFLYITDVQLEQGRYATSFERRPISQELQLCQRYYEKSYSMDTAPGTANVGGPSIAFQERNQLDGSGLYRYMGQISFSVEKFTSPTFSIWSQAGTANRGTTNRAGNAGTSGWYNMYVATSGDTGATVLVPSQDVGTRGAIVVFPNTGTLTSLDFLVFHWAVSAEM